MKVIFFRNRTCSSRVLPHKTEVFVSTYFIGILGLLFSLSSLAMDFSKKPPEQSIQDFVMENLSKYANERKINATSQNDFERSKDELVKMLRQGEAVLSGHKLTIGQETKYNRTKVGERTIKTNFALSVYGTSLAIASTVIIKGEKRFLDMHFKCWEDIKDARKIAQEELAEQ